MYKPLKLNKKLWPRVFRIERIEAIIFINDVTAGQKKRGMKE